MLILLVEDTEKKVKIMKKFHILKNEILRVDSHIRFYKYVNTMVAKALIEERKDLYKQLCSLDKIPYMKIR